MAPIREYLCHYCGHQFEALVYAQDPDDYKFADCSHCESRAEVLPSLIGGYQGSLGPSSTRPKNSTSMPKKKAFTKVDTKDGKNAFGYEESDQLSFEFEKESKK